MHTIAAFALVAIMVRGLATGWKHGTVWPVVVALVVFAVPGLVTYHATEGAVWLFKEFGGWSAIAWHAAAMLGIVFGYVEYRRQKAGLVKVFPSPPTSTRARVDRE